MFKACLETANLLWISDLTYSVCNEKLANYVKIIDHYTDLGKFTADMGSKYLL